MLICRLACGAPAHPQKPPAPHPQSQPDFRLSLIPDLLYEARAIARSLVDYSAGAHVRLGVTGLSRAGKTVFITALIEHLTKAASPALRGRKNTLPVFRVHAEGRLIGGALEPQPDDDVPRFAYEDHIDALAGPGGRAEARHWPQSTRRISEMRLSARFRPAEGRPAPRPAFPDASTSSIIPANGCSTCRCCRNPSRNGRGNLRRRATARRARRSPRNGAASSPASIRRPNSTKPTRGGRPSCSPPICAPAAPTNMASRACRRGAS